MGGWDGRTGRWDDGMGRWGGVEATGYSGGQERGVVSGGCEGSHIG